MANIINILDNQPFIIGFNHTETNPLIIRYEIISYDSNTINSIYHNWITKPENNGKTFNDFLKTTEFVNNSTKLDRLDTNIYELSINSINLDINKYVINTNITEFGKIKLHTNKIDTEYNGNIFINLVEINIKDKRDEQKYYETISLNTNTPHISLLDNQTNIDLFVNQELIITPLFKDNKLLKNVDDSYNIYIDFNPVDSELLNNTYDIDLNRFYWNNLLFVKPQMYTCNITLTNNKLKFNETKTFMVNIKSLSTGSKWILKNTEINFIQRKSDNEFIRIEIVLDNTKDNMIILN